MGYRYHRESHPRGQGFLLCRARCILSSRRWPVDRQYAYCCMVTNALGMAINSRNTDQGTLIHSDQGTQFTPWAFTHRAKASGWVPSMGSIGDPERDHDGGKRHMRRSLGSRRSDSPGRRDARLLDPGPKRLECAVEICCDLLLGVLPCSQGPALLKIVAL